jgi:uncharacterized membrane protein
MEATTGSEHLEHRKAELAQVHSAFGTDRFGSIAEKVARFFGTPQYILGQTVLVVLWILVNAAAVSLRWDPYPFILLNLAFSTQAAYAAPLILLAQTRQADRDKVVSEMAAKHRDQLSATEMDLLQQNTDLTEQVAKLTREIDALTREIHRRLTA